MKPHVLAVALCAHHQFSKQRAEVIALRVGLGVLGDAHAGATVQHRSRVARDPAQPNLRQVHILQAELLDDFQRCGFHVQPGELGENITTRGLDVLALPTDTVLSIGATAKVRITGLRNPCSQIDTFQKGLLRQAVDRDAGGNLIRKAGVMGVIVHDGVVSAGDVIGVEVPPGDHRPLECV